MKRSTGIIAVIVVPIALVILASQSLYVVDMTKQAIITEMGKFVRTNTEPGLDMKIPFIQQVQFFDKRIVVSDAPPAEYLTLDKKRLMVDNYARWRISDPIQFFMTVRNERGALSRLQGIVFSELRTHIAAHPFAEIIGEKRENIMDGVTDKANVIISQFGIELVDVRIKRADLPKEVQASVYARMKAERQRIAKKYRAEGEEKALAIRANADKEATIISADAKKSAEELMGEGDALATSIYADAYQQDPEFYAFTKSIETYDKALQGKTTLVLDASAPLFKYLSGQ